MGRPGRWHRNRSRARAAAPLAAAAPMLRLCCGRRAKVAVVAPDIVAGLPARTRNSSVTSSGEFDNQGEAYKEVPVKSKYIEESQVNIPICDNEALPSVPRSPSIRIEEPSSDSDQVDTAHAANLPTEHDDVDLVEEFDRPDESESPQKHAKSQSTLSSPEKEVTHQSQPASPESPRRSREASADGGGGTPGSAAVGRERDVRAALGECVAQARCDDWEAVASALGELQRLASDSAAHAPSAAWRLAARAAATHVRSLRSRVARAACVATGALFEYRGRALDPELEEAAAALLDRCADVNRFLRADAAAALAQLACGGSGARCVTALARRGATHRAGPARAATAVALTRLAGGGSLLRLPAEPRSLLLRAAGDLLADAHPEARAHGRQLCLALADDRRFKQLFKEAMTPAKYRTIEKYLEKLHCR